MKKQYQASARAGLAVLALVMCVPLAAQAAYVSIDRSSVGDGQITLDTVSNLEWLDLDQTKPLSVNEAIADFSGDGWRGATFADVNGLIGSFFGITPIANNNQHAVEGTKAAEFVSLFGTTYIESGSPFSWGRYVGEGSSAGPWASVKSAGIDSTYLIFNSDYYNLNSPHIFSGVFLVRDHVSPVPLPAAVWLFGSALIGAGVIGKRRKKNA